jgi:2-oxoisovalerate dehydrogenase E1 component alpha subunit
MGLRLDGAPGCAIAYFGDGAASEGDFHEAANLAAVFHAPVVLFCQNNGWAISVPTTSQTAGEIWRRAEGYGFPGVRVDGNDVLAVYRVTRDAVARAHAGDGPTLIEALTYRVGPHTTADDASRYRDEAEVERWRELDPISRYRTWLLDAGYADDAFVADCEAFAESRVAEIRAAVVATEPPPVSWMFDWTYAEPPEPLVRQRAEALGDA